MNVAANKNSSHAGAYPGGSYVYAITIKTIWACTFFEETRCSCKMFAEYCQVSAKDAL